MKRILSTIADRSSVVNREDAKMSALIDIAAMRDGTWRQRLEEAIERSGRSWRDVSLSAGLSPGYVHSIMADAKEPTIGRLIAITDALGESPMRILYGLEITGDAEDLLRLYADLDESQRKAFLALAKTLPTRKR